MRGGQDGAAESGGDQGNGECGGHAIEDERPLEPCPDLVVDG